MSASDEHLRNIQEQFTKQGADYSKLRFVRDEEGLERVVAMARVSAEDRVLDVASGPGFLTMAFAEACAEATGIDATQAFVDAAREEAAKRGLDNVSFKQGNAEALDVLDGAFDIAVCRAAFHHFPRPERVLSEMKRAVPSGGKVIVIDMVASEDIEKAEYHNRIERLCDPTHVRCLSESEFQRIFEDADLKLAHTGRGETCYGFDEWIAHGGPSPDNIAIIRRLMEDSIENDLAGFKVWREDGELRFCHFGCGFVLEK